MYFSYFVLWVTRFLVGFKRMLRILLTEPDQVCTPQLVTPVFHQSFSSLQFEHSLYINQVKIPYLRIQLLLNNCVEQTCWFHSDKIFKIIYNIISNTNETPNWTISFFLDGSHLQCEIWCSNDPPEMQRHTFHGFKQSTLWCRC